MLKNYEIEDIDWPDFSTSTCCGIQELGNLDSIDIYNIEKDEYISISNLTEDPILQIELIRKVIQEVLDKTNYNATIVYIPNNKYWNSWRIAFELENFHEAFCFSSKSGTYNITAFVKIHKIYSE